MWGPQHQSPRDWLDCMPSGPMGAAMGVPVGLARSRPVARGAQQISGAEAAGLNGQTRAWPLTIDVRVVRARRTKEGVGPAVRWPRGDALRDDHHKHTTHIQ